MDKKISAPVAIIICIAVIALVVVVGNVIYQKQNGGDVASQMNAAMAKAKPGVAPFSAEQMAQMRQQGTGPSK